MKGESDMSMNLFCNQVDLWQTPTHISYMCMIDDNGNMDPKTGKKAVAVLKRYIEYVRYRLSSIRFSSDEEYELEKGVTDDHIQQVLDAINNTPPRKLKVYII